MTSEEAIEELKVLTNCRRKSEGVGGGGGGGRGRGAGVFLLAVVRWVMGGRDVVLSCIGIRRYDHHKRYYDYGRVLLLYLCLSGIVVVVVLLHKGIYYSIIFILRFITYR